MTPGQVVTVRGLRGTWRVRGTATDGSVWVWGGPVMKPKMRAVRPERVRAAVGK